MREDLALRLERFKEQWSVDAAAQGRVARPMVKFIGEEVLDTAVAALLQGENLLLAGGKATGKNVLAGQPCMALRAPGVHRLVPCEHRQQYAHRHRHLHRRRGAAAPRSHRACGAVRWVLRAR